MGGGGGGRDILQFQHECFTVNGPREKWQKPVTHILAIDITNDLYNNHNCTHKERKKKGPLLFENMLDIATRFWLGRVVPGTDTSSAFAKAGQMSKQQ